MYTITVTQKGQVVIPAKLRKKLNIKKGTKLIVREEDGGIFMAPSGRSYVSKLRGMFKSNDGESATEFLLRERAEDTAMMEKKWKR
ncbi:MAG TPA: AbrB/MazE/SpoVT family DNA-binding domain-containing protein [Candidatus Goldiibacteriota bacterium]|nr:AbrB/MazE/SpoVT family DNA-binding domain-containing protein [Candidatus Goldiibacteriota bacterium]